LIDNDNWDGKKPASVDSKDNESAVMPDVESEDDTNKKPAAIKSNNDAVALGSFIESFDDCNENPAAVESEDANAVGSSGALILDWGTGKSNGRERLARGESRGGVSESRQGD
jgi:hypothetical protein